VKSISIPKLNLKGLTFDVKVPSSKSLANRALVLAALSKGEFSLKGDFEAEDIQLMIEALRKMGIGIEAKAGEGLLIKNDLSWMADEGDLELFLGNSGTSIRFLTSLVLFRKGTTLLTGKDRMKERPIGDLVDALRQIGAHITYLDKEGFPPLFVRGLENVSGGVIRMRGDVSSQFLTSVLLISSQFSSGLQVKVDGELISKPYVEMTLELMKSWGVHTQHDDRGYSALPQLMIGQDFVIEGDASAATYWWALSHLHDCVINIQNVQNDSIQGDVHFKKVLNMLSNCTGPFEIDMNNMPDASLTLMAVAPFHHDVVTITNIGSLRVKETDRIEAMATELRRVGVMVETGVDWVKVWPGEKEQTGDSKSISVHTYDDHRIAMSMAVLATKLGSIVILDPDCVKKSYPEFWNHLSRFTESEQ
jgi:3-phosphoshikimate 1-carboxyvinyltransferase